METLVVEGIIGSHFRVIMMCLSLLKVTLVSLQPNTDQSDGIC